MKALGEKLQSLTIMHRNGSVVVPWEWLVQAAQNAGANDKIGVHLLSGSVIFKMTIGGKNAELKVSAPAVLSMKFTPAKGRAPESYTLVNKESKNVATFANYENGMLSVLVYENGHFDATDNPDAAPYIPASAADAFLSYKVSASVLNLRKGGSMSFDVIDKLPRGTVVTVEYLSGNWAYIHTDAGVTGWVYSKYLTAQ